MYNLEIVHVTAGIHPTDGGPSRTVPQLTDALARRGDIHVTLLTQGFSGEPSVASCGDVDRRMMESSSRAALKFGLPVRVELNRIVTRRAPALIHSHGLWTAVNYWASRAARRHRIPLMIHPRGMLEPWALAYKGLKKEIALRVFQQRDLLTAAVFFATAEQEAEQLRRLGFRQPIAVTPNGVHLPAYNKILQTGRADWHGCRTALFLSRIHPKKGILNLLDAWARLRPGDWSLCLAGPDEDGHLQDVMQRVRDLGLGDSVQYLGELDGHSKLDVYTRAELFVLPSFSENFGVVVAEAMACGLPVIATHGTPWSGLVTRGCGWWVEPSVDALAGALKAACALDEPTLAAMGERSREYAAEFDWAEIARETVAVYFWVAGLGPRPSAVIMD